MALFHAGLQPALDSNGDPISGATWNFYVTEGLTPASVYADAALQVSLGATVTADAAGRFVDIYFDDAVTYRAILKDAGGATIKDVDPVNSAGDAAGVTFDPSGTGSVDTTVGERLNREVRVFDFYTAAQKAACLAGTQTDVSTAMTAAITYAKTLRSPTLIVDYGNHYVGTANVVFDLPDRSTIIFQGTITSAATSGAVVTIGSLSGNIFYQDIQNIKVERTTNDTTNTSVGVQLLNLASCRISVNVCLGFRQGVLCNGVGYGFVYNTIFLGYIHDNRTNLQLSASGGAGGYNNENKFYGGTTGHSLSYPAVSTTNLIIDYNATNSLNNNQFYGLSLEDNADPAGGVVAAEISGQYNVLHSPRLENAADQAAYQIVFTANSLHCDIVGRGFALEQGNIDDSGTANSWDVTDGTRLSRSTPDDATKAVLKLQSTSSNNARLLQFLDTNGTEVAYYTASGIGRLERVYFNAGIRWGTQSGTFDDRGLFEGTGSPEGVVTARVGSMYSRRDGGAGTSFYVKESGTGNTGWVAK